MEIKMPVNFEKDSSDEPFEVDDEVMLSLSIGLTNVLVGSIKEQVLNQVIPSLGPQNFRGEAINFMKDNNIIPITEKGIPAVPNVSKEILGIKQYSELMYIAFKKDVNDLIIYDEKTNSILISPIIDAFEYGDFYRPLLKTITRSIEDAFREL
jgi:hypothetical protein